MQERHTASAGRTEQEADPFLLCQLRKLRALRSYQRLIGGHEVLAGFQRSTGIRKSRLNPAHHFRNHIDRGIFRYLLDGGNLERLVILPRPYQHGPRFKPFRMFQHFIDSDTYRAVT